MAKAPAKKVAKKPEKKPDKQPDKKPDAKAPAAAREAKPAAPPRPERPAVPAKFLPFGRAQLRAFVLAVVMPPVIALGAGIGVTLYLLDKMAADIDRVEEVRGVTAMHAALDSFVNDLAQAAADEGTWNEAFLNVVMTPNPAWMDTTWGTTARLGQTYDAVVVTDQVGTVMFGEDNAGAIAGNIAARFPSARAMLTQLDKGIAATGDATTATGFAADRDGTAGLAAISIHKSTPGEVAVPRQDRRILWLVRHVTPEILQDFAARYQTTLARLGMEAEPGASSLDIAGPDGTVAGVLSWDPEHPGDGAAAGPRLVAMGIFAALALTLVGALWLVWRAMQSRVAAVEKVYVAAREIPTTTATAFTAKATDNPAAAAVEVEAELPVTDLVSAANFEIAYQPIFDLRAETLIGAEALLRWKKPDGSFLEQEAIPPAQLHALLDRIGVLAFRRAADEIAPLGTLGVTLAASPGQICNSVFTEKIAGTLGATGFKASRLQFALDLAGIADIGPLRAPVAEMRRLGITVSLAEFALTPATLGQVDGFADRICLPRSLVSGIDGDAARLALVEATMGVAQSAGLAITAPFVARKEEAGKLLRLGCRDFQGPLFAEPMPIGALTALVLKPPAQERKAS